MKVVKKRKEADLISHLCLGKTTKLKIAIDNTTHFAVEKSLKRALKIRINRWVKDVPAWPENYKVKDVAFRVAGIGSVGLKRYMFLLQHNTRKHKFLVVEIKQTRPSCLSPYVNVQQPEWKSEIERLIAIKRRMQNLPPALLSEIDFEGEAHPFQEMQPIVDKIKFNLIDDNRHDLEKVIKAMAMLTASVQIRSSGMQGSVIIDNLAAFARRSDWQDHVMDYAHTYEKQVDSDYKEFNADVAADKFLF